MLLQVSELFDGGKEVSAFDATVKLWLDAYREWGHMTEGGTATLRYDTRCCHTQGECEWQVCADTILTRLVGGTAAAGVYVGSEDHVVVPVVQHAGAGAAPGPAPYLIFNAWNVRRASVALGADTDTELAVLATSSAPNRTLTLKGGFVAITKPGQRIEVTTTLADGTVAGRQVVTGAVGAQSVTVSTPLLSKTNLKRVG